jgi:glycosyltransferase involved in cell wall biosynthesis
LTSQKGPDLLLDALPRLRRQHRRARFLFAGDGDMRDGLEQRARKLGVTPAVRFLGHQTGRDLLGLFKTADMVCVPSRNEPFGIVILEAWSARKPVVATRNGGPAEFIRNEDTGVTVAADHASIGEGVDAVLSDRTYGRRLGRNGRREAESHFAWDVIAAQTEEVYQSVLQR